MSIHMMPSMLWTRRFGDTNKDTLVWTIGWVDDGYFENHVIRVYNFKEQSLKTTNIVPRLNFSKEDDCKDFCPKITVKANPVLSWRQYLYNYLHYRHHSEYNWNGIQLYHVVSDAWIGRKIPSFVPGYFQLSNLKDNGKADLIYHYPGNIIISDTQQVAETKKFLLDLKKKSYIWEQPESVPELWKPVIYLYPQTPQQVHVWVTIRHGSMQVSYPAYADGGRDVTAYPDGKVINSDGKEYSYLFWEGIGNLQVDRSEGFIVAGNQAREFLQDTLPKLWLTPKEYNEFIVYRYPIMLRNKRNYVKFLQKEYQDEVTMDISPKPDSLLRVFMYFESIDTPFEVKKQVFQKFERKGFTVVEWGGSQWWRE